VKRNHDVGRERYDLPGFGVADFFGGTTHAAEWAETTQGDRFFCFERLGYVFEQGAEDSLAFDVGEAEGFCEGAGEVGLGQGLLGFFSDVVFNWFGDFAEVRRGFAEDFPNDVVPGEVLFANVFVQGGLGVFVQHCGSTGGLRWGDRVDQDGGDGFIERGEKLINRAFGGTEFWFLQFVF
jgi:hypothetical protein